MKVEQKGYLYVYLSNEQTVQTNVYFDDFRIVHQKGVVQVDDYYPFGLAFNSYGRENSTPNDYKYNGKEEQTELGLGWLDYGARMYDPTVSRWMTIDPLASKYLSMSPYAYVANNPIKFIDPDGKKIIIFGARYGFLGLRRQKYEYHAGASAPEGANQFAKDSFKALNHARGGDKNGIIDALAESDDKHVYVKRTGKSNGFYNHNNNTIRWNSEMGAELLDEDERVTGRQPAAMVLFHEIGHGYRENFMPEEYYNDLATDDDQYGTVEERKVIENYETPAAKELGYGTRSNHGGRLYPTDGPTSTTPLRVNSPRAPKLDVGPPDKKPEYLGSAGPADGRKRIDEKTNGY